MPFIKKKSEKIPYSANTLTVSPNFPASIVYFANRIKYRLKTSGLYYLAPVKALYQSPRSTNISNPWMSPL